MIWANFLHFYQPSIQKKYWVDRITQESYSRILKELQQNPNARLTINISAVLLELWDKFGHQKVITGFKGLIDRGQIEVTGSAKYHPLLPKLPQEEIERQIRLNEVTLHQYLGVVGPGLNSQLRTNNPELLKGFFPPEMAFDSRIATIVARLGYRWIVCEELSYSDQLGQVKYDRLYETADEVKAAGKESGSHLKVFFRDRHFSYKILSGQLGTANLFLAEIGERLNQPVYLFTAMDGETFGHHRPGLEKLLFEVYRETKIETATLSQLPQHFQKTEVVSIKPSTWALMEQDVEKRLAYSRWDDSDNEIHQLQWQLTDLAIEAIQNSIRQLTDKMQNFGSLTSPDTSIFNFSAQDGPASGGDLSTFNLSGQAWSGASEQVKSWVKARNLLDQALHSDQYWWASARPWWSLEMIERGARDLLEVVRVIEGEKEAQGFIAYDQNSHRFRASLSGAGGSGILVAQAWALYLNIIIIGFEWQRQGIVEEKSRKEDEEIRMRTDHGLPKIPKEELKKMINHIETEMWQVAKNKEFERAAQLRDRVRELEAFLK